MAQPRDERLAEIRARVEKADAGPWTVRRGEMHGVLWIPFVMGPRGTIADCGDESEEDNAQFMAHAREDIPWLLAQHAAMWDLLTLLMDDDANRATHGAAWDAIRGAVELAPREVDR